MKCLTDRFQLKFREGKTKRKKAMEGLDKYLTNEPMTNDKFDVLYNIIYADPAWKFGSRLANGNDKNGIVNLKQVKIGDNYTVMTTDDICRLPVKNMTADDAILFYGQQMHTWKKQ